MTIYATLARRPCIGVRAGFDTEGLPIGLRRIGRPQAELEVLRLARADDAAAQDVLGVRPAEPPP